MDRKIEPGTQTDKNVATQTKYAGSSATSEKSGYRWEKEETIAEKRLSISPLLFISFKLLDSTLDLVPMGVQWAEAIEQHRVHMVSFPSHWVVYKCFLGTYSKQLI